MQLFSLGIKMKVVQNFMRTSDSHYVNTSIRQYVSVSVCVSMSVCQYATFQIRYQNESCSECHMDVRQSLCHYVNTSVCQYVNMSVCQYVRMRLFRTGIKIKVVRNVIRMSAVSYTHLTLPTKA